MIEPETFYRITDAEVLHQIEQAYFADYPIPPQCPRIQIASTYFYKDALLVGKLLDFVEQTIGHVMPTKEELEGPWTPVKKFIEGLKTDNLAFVEEIQARDRLADAIVARLLGFWNLDLRQITYEANTGKLVQIICSTSDTDWLLMALSDAHKSLPTTPIETAPACYLEWGPVDKADDPGFDDHKLEAAANAVDQCHAERDRKMDRAKSQRIPGGGVNLNATFREVNERHVAEILRSEWPLVKKRSDPFQAQKQGTAVPPAQPTYLIARCLDVDDSTKPLNHSQRNEIYTEASTRLPRVLLDYALELDPRRTRCVGYIDMGNLRREELPSMCIYYKIDPVSTEFMHYVNRMLKDRRVGLIVINHVIAPDFTETEDRSQCPVHRIEDEMQFLHRLLNGNGCFKPIVFVSPIRALCRVLDHHGAFSVATPERAFRLVRHILDRTVSYGLASAFDTMELYDNSSFSTEKEGADGPAVHSQSKEVTAPGDTQE